MSIFGGGSYTSKYPTGTAIDHQLDKADHDNREILDTITIQRIQLWDSKASQNYVDNKFAKISIQPLYQQKFTPHDFNNEKVLTIPATTHHLGKNVKIREILKQDGTSWIDANNEITFKRDIATGSATITANGDTFTGLVTLENSDTFIASLNDQGSTYILPIGGEVLGGVKNGGNVTINPDGTMTGATQYKHPNNHPASMIIEDTNRQFVSSNDKTTWNNKADNTLASPNLDGMMSKADKTKLDTIEANANYYVHPDIHLATMITETDEKQFVSSIEKNEWNRKASTNVATPVSNGLMQATDKTKLDTIEANANYYVHPAKHSATMIEETTNLQFVSAADKLNWNSKSGTSEATPSTAGIMSASDKAKLDGIDPRANYYTHPSTHPSSMITESHDKQFISQADRTRWDGKADNFVATFNTNGLLAYEEKVKLHNIQEGANFYEHPATHPASIIEETLTKQFVTAEEKISWSNKADNSLATVRKAGLMSHVDKAALDEISIKSAQAPGHYDRSTEQPTASTRLNYNGHMHATKFYGAVYNDIAEYRVYNEKCIDVQSLAGRVVTEASNDSVLKTTKRLQPACKVVSDTYGYAIGHACSNSVPLAIAGRVLVYTDKDRYTFKPGDPVCSGPRGTVSKMSRWECILYPDRILGYVSCVPDYNRWGTDNIHVNKRIWIYVK